MKKFLFLVLALAVFTLMSHAPVRAWVYLGDKGDTGWQAYCYCAGDQGFTGVAGFVVSNVRDNSAYSDLLLDSLSKGPPGNAGFEMGNLTGYSLLEESWGEVAFGFLVAPSGRIYKPPEGEFMARLFCLAPGVDTSGFRNSRGQPGTCGAILEVPLSLGPGDHFCFKWAFIAGDKAPYNDFSLFYLKDADGNIIFADILGEIGRGQLPGISLLLLQ